MRTTRRFAVIAALCAVGCIVLVACGGDGNVRVVGQDGSEVSVSGGPIPTEGTAETPGEGTPTEPPAPMPTMEPTGTPTDTSEATPEATPAAGTSPGTPPTTGSEAGDLEGTPYSTADVRLAIAAERREFLVVEDRAPLCPNTSVREVVFWGAPEGSDYGPRWSLWIYPDNDALTEDWGIEDGSLRPVTGGCELPTGFNYYNANAVLAFVAWYGLAGERLYDESRSPGADAVREAFLAMGTGGSSDTDED